MNDRKRQRWTRRRAALGAAMSEMVLVTPFLLVILALTFYFGRLVVRNQHAQVMARYETWRQVTDAPGPSSQEPGSHSQLNSAFFGSSAASVTHALDDRRFSEEPYELFVEAARLESADAGDFAEAYVYEPDGETPRLSHGHREGFAVTYTTDVPLLRDMEGPIRRHHARIGHEWHYVNDWTAGPDEWRGGTPTPHHLRALRDVFYADFDERLDAIDGATDPEYSTDDTQRATDAVLAGFIRSLYLHDPRYRGPIVHDENQ